VSHPEEHGTNTRFIIAACALLFIFALMLVNGCGTFQRKAKNGSDLRNHCFATAQLCTEQGTKQSPFGHRFSEPDLDLRCQRLDEDAELWDYSCSNYLP